MIYILLILLIIKYRDDIFAFRHEEKFDLKKFLDYENSMRKDD